jgi:phospholipase C
MTGMSDPVPRRRVIQGLAAGAGLMLTGCQPWLGRPGQGHGLKGPGDRPDPSKPEGVDLLPQIEHIVVYMQENHSYDSYFGTFRRGDGRYWDGSDVPFYWSLAETFPLCDRWFASAPAQTYPNRMYLQAATCQDLTTTDVGRAFAMPHPAGGTIWEKLDEFGISWLDDAWDLPDIALFPSLWQARLDRVRTFPSFLADCQAGTLPDVAIVSPGVTAYTEENPRDIQLGEAYSASVINAVLASPAWPRTVLVFMYDEHGGYYDHVAPPRAVPPDDIPPDVEPTPDAPAASDHYGLRVPAFVISPFARRHHVSHVVHDHTSVLRLIETKFNLGALTRRDANASNLLDCLDLRGRPAFLDPPELAAPGLPPAGSVCQPETPPPPTRPAVEASPAVAGLGILVGTEAHLTVSGPPLTESQDERLRYLDLLARR